MLPTREITYPIRLTSAQLAMLLSFVSAKTLLGSDEATLFPANEADREAQWARGHAELLADGWMVHNPEDDTYPVNGDLMVIIGALADPEVVVLSAWETGPQQGYGLTHYLSLDLVIEMALIDGIYQLTALESLNTMGMRLSNSLGYPAEAPDGLSVRFPKEEMAQLWRERDASLLSRHGAGPLSAQSFAATLQHPAAVGTIQVVRAYLGRPLSMRMVDVVVGQSGTGWVGQLLDDQQLVRYDAVNADGAAAIISALVVEVRSIPLENVLEPQAR